MSSPIYTPPAITYHYDPMSLAAARPWHIEDRDLPSYWETTGAGEGVVVAVLDSGVDVNHRGLVDRLVAVESQQRDEGHDRFGHGTHMCGLVGDQYCGYAPRAKLISIKVLDDNGNGNDDTVAAGVDRAIALGADIVSVSIGSPQMSRKMADTMKKLWEAGTIVVASSGNAAAHRIFYPAGLDQYVVAVGAIDRAKRRAAFSNYDNRENRLDLVDFGQEVAASAIGGGYARITGTSAATALAAGALANLVSFARKSGTWKSGPIHYPEILGEICEDLGRDGRDNELGFGQIDFSKFISNPRFAPTA